MYFSLFKSKQDLLKDGWRQAKEDTYRQQEEERKKESAEKLRLRHLASDIEHEVRKQLEARVKPECLKPAGIKEVVWGL